MRSIFFLCVLAALAGCATGPAVPPSEPAASAAGETGALTFETEGSLQRAGRRGEFTRGAAQRISGELRLPAGEGPFPALVLAHGCAGNRGVEPAWGTLLRAWGYATFVLDSFGERGLAEVCSNGQALLPLQRVPDAYGALRLLAAHPRVDPKRIALMGFSHGGALTMLAATAWAKDAFVPAGQPGFRAFIAFYPNCNPVFPERDHVSAPLRIHAGADDDWTPAKPCAQLAATLAAAGEDVAIDVYPGAQHAFDQARGRVYLPNAGNGADCFPVLASILGPVVAGTASCVKRGATVAPSAEAAEQARRNLRAQLSSLLR